MWQPHATLTVAFNGAGVHPPRPAKGVETRSWEPWIPVPFDVVIHATKKWTPAFTALVRTWPFRQCLEQGGYHACDPRKFLRDHPHDAGGWRKWLPLGALIGVATVVRVAPIASFLAEWSRYEDGAAERYAEEVAFGDYSPGRFGWELANARALLRPIPFRGRQEALYEIPSEIDAAIDAQLAESVAA